MNRRITPASTPPDESALRPAPSRHPNFGFTRAAVWLRLTLANEMAEPQDYVLDVGREWIGEVDLWSPSTHVKPANVLLHREGERVVPKIADFGISRIGPSSARAAEPLADTITRVLLGPLGVEGEQPVAHLVLESLVGLLLLVGHGRAVGSDGDVAPKHPTRSNSAVPRA